MTNQIYDQLARTTLLPGEISAEILSGNRPALEEIVLPLLIGALDCGAVIVGDDKSSWNDRRFARLGLILTFLLAIGLGEE